MLAITDRIFRDNIFDYRTCADCPDADGCEEKQNMKEPVSYTHLDVYKRQDMYFQWRAYSHGQEAAIL